MNLRIFRKTLDKMLALLLPPTEGHCEAYELAAAESSLSKDWLTPEEDAAWADL
jgi:hypothetical protein